MQITIATWNIAGGRPIRSEGRFDYDAEDVEYFTKQLRLVNPDVVCLQETHINSERSVAKEIAQSLGLRIHETAMSPSHIDSRYSLGNALLHKVSETKEQDYIFPYPSFSLVLPDGKPAAHHDKGFQIDDISTLSVVNLQMMPLKFLGTPYDSHNGEVFAKEMEDILLKYVRDSAVICGDFNFANPKQLYSRLLSNRNDVLPDVPTRPEGKKTDFIFVPEGIVCIDSGVIKTNTDHFLCWVTLEIA